MLSLHILPQKKQKSYCFFSSPCRAGVRQSLHVKFEIFISLLQKRTWNTSWNVCLQETANNKCDTYSLTSEFVALETFATMEEFVLASLQLARTNTGDCEGGRVRSGSESDNSHGRPLLLESVSHCHKISYTDLRVETGTIASLMPVPSCKCRSTIYISLASKTCSCSPNVKTRSVLSAAK